MPACAPTPRATSLPDSTGVLITRPEPGASDTAARVTALGLQPILAPLLRVATLHPSFPPSGRVQAILATSGNAIAALPESHRHLRLFAVGQATARTCRRGGLRAGQERRWRRRGACRAGGAILPSQRPGRCCLPPAAAMVRHSSAIARAWIPRPPPRQLCHDTRAEELPHSASRCALAAGSIDRGTVLFHRDRPHWCPVAADGAARCLGRWDRRAGYQSDGSHGITAAPVGERVRVALSRTRMRCWRCCDDRTRCTSAAGPAASARTLRRTTTMCCPG